MSRIDEILAGAPSVAAFCELLAALAQLDARTRDEQIVRAQACLASWPDELRAAGDELLVGEGVALQPSAVLVRKLAFKPSHAGCAPELVVALARAPELADLTILDLFAEDVDCTGAMAIAESDTLVHLRELRLGQHIADAGFVALARSTKLPRLEVLHLSGTLGDDETAEALAASPRMAMLEQLQWDDDGLSDAGLWALAASPWLRPHLRAEFLACLAPELLRERADELGVDVDALDDDELVDTLAHAIHKS